MTREMNERMRKWEKKIGKISGKLEMDQFHGKENRETGCDASFDFGFWKFS